MHPPLPPLFFFLCRSSLTVFLLQMHRDPLIAVPLFFPDPHLPRLLLTNTKRLAAATWFVFSFLFLFYLLTAFFSFVHIVPSSCGTLVASPPCHVSPLVSLTSPLVSPTSPLVMPLSRCALPLTNVWRECGVTLQPPSAFFLSLFFSFSFADFPFFSRLPPARPFTTHHVAPRVPRPQASSVTRRILLPPLTLGHPPFPAWSWDMT